MHLLATEKTLEPLSKHPYITAFLDLHYSVVEKARSQMKDSVPHLALMLLLLELSSTMGGRLCNDHDNIMFLAVPFFFIVATFDVISLIGIRTSFFDKVLSGSQVRDRDRKRVCLPSKSLPCFQQAVQIFNNIIHLAGYGIFIATLFYGYLLPRNDSDDYTDFCEALTRAKTNNAKTMSGWKLQRIGERGKYSATITFPPT